MAHVNGEFKHEYHDITIEVLEPTRDELSYEDGMQIDVTWDIFTNMNLEEFRKVLKWMSETAYHIEKTYTKKGKLKKTNPPH